MCVGGSGSEGVRIDTIMSLLDLSAQGGLGGCFVVLLRSALRCGELSCSEEVRSLLWRRFSHLRYMNIHRVYMLEQARVKEVRGESSHCCSSRDCIQSKGLIII